MSDDDTPPGSQDELTTWRSARDRIIRFATNLLRFESTLDRLVRNQGAQQKLLNDLDDRVTLCREEVVNDKAARLVFHVGEDALWL